MTRILATLPALALLAACGGGAGAGPQSIGSIATAGGSQSGTAVATTGTGTGTGVSATGLGGVASTSGSTASTLLKTAATYNAVSSVQSYTYKTADNRIGQYGQIYSGNASTVRNPTTTVAYDPRDAIFTLTIKDTSGINQVLRFQDPAHRTDFAGARVPQFGVPDMTSSGVVYLQSGGGTGSLCCGTNQIPMDGATGSSSDVSTFFYQKPGTSTSYVTFAGYVRNSLAFANVTPTTGSTYKETSSVLERGAFVFGDVTSRDQTPTRGTGNYSGAFIATMIDNPTRDDVSPLDSYYQWIGGTSKVAVDFTAGTVALNLAGTVGAPFVDRNTTGGSIVPGGATFTAAGTAAIDLPRSGGFVGTIGSARFDWTGGSQVLTIAGSSVDGAFYGPNAAEVGGSVRIVGGTPDQRIDILGAFTAR